MQLVHFDPMFYDIKYIIWFIPQYCKLTEFSDECLGIKLFSLTEKYNMHQIIV